MQTTANYGLKKPEGTDVVDVQNFNDNADVVDTKIAALTENLNTHKADNTNQIRVLSMGGMI